MAPNYISIYPQTSTNTQPSLEKLLAADGNKHRDPQLDNVQRYKSLMYSVMNEIVLAGFVYQLNTN